MQERERLPGEIRPETGACNANETLNERITALIEDQEWLEPIAKGVQGVVGRIMDRLGPSVTDILHGTWLRHPLHPAMTDVPIGAWTVSFALDLLDIDGNDPRLTSAADAALTVGIASAVPVALTGTADWRHVYGYPRRAGLVHAVLNSTGLLFQIGSLVLRLKGNRRPAVALSMFGYTATSMAAWLGGELVYKEGIGANHTAFQEGPRDFVAVLPLDNLNERQLTKVQAKGVPVLLFRQGDDVYAIAETCSHQGGSLAKGDVEGEVVKCPRHGSRFRLTDGRLVHGPATFDQPCFEARIRDGYVEVKQSSAAH